MHTVFALLCFVVLIHWLIFPYPSGLLHWHCGNLTIAPVPAKATLVNMDKYFMWIHYERLHNHNKAKHNKTVCIFLGIYCKYSSSYTTIHVFEVKPSMSNYIDRKKQTWCSFLFMPHVDDFLRKGTPAIRSVKLAGYSILDIGHSNVQCPISNIRLTSRSSSYLQYNNMHSFCHDFVVVVVDVILFCFNRPLFIQYFIPNFVEFLSDFLQ